MNKSLYSWMTLEKWALALVLMLIIAVAGFNIASTLIMIVLERTSQIGLLMAIGVQRSDIVKIFVIQGFIVGLAGTILGALFGVGICFLQQHFGLLSLPPDIYTISKLPLNVRVFDVLWICSFSILLSLACSIYPAYRASRLDPIDAIRYGG
jgi:lipoprotein-releasing system permease protein